MTSAHLKEVIVRAVENVSDIVEISDDEGQLLYVNAAFEQTTGWRLEEVLGKTPGSFLRGGEHDESFYERIWETVSSGEPWQGRITSKAKDGRRIIQEAFVSPIRDAQGAISHYVAIKRDITARTRLESQLLHTDRLAAVGQLAAGVAHEINNPLSYMLANLGYLKRCLDDDGTEGDAEFLDQLHELVDEISHGAAQIRDIVRDLGSMTRTNPMPTGVKLADVIDFARRLIDHELGEHIQVDAAYAGLPKVWGDRSQLTQVFVNLLINAAHAVESVEDEPKISIVGSLEGEEAVVTICDNGVGMSPEVRERIFEPFFTTKEVGEGTGLGLSICYGIVTGMNGTINVASEDGVGTTFELRLPAEPVVSSEELEL